MHPALVTRLSAIKPHDALPHGVTTFLPSLGVTNTEAISNVTAFAAEVCGVADRTGTLEIEKGRRHPRRGRQPA